MDVPEIVDSLTATAAAIAVSAQKRRQAEDAEARAVAACFKEYLGIGFNAPARLVFRDGVELLVHAHVKAGAGNIRFPKVTLRD